MKNTYYAKSSNQEGYQPSVKELCERYHTTMLFSSATQPEYGVLPYMQKIGWNPTEGLPGEN